MYLYRAKKMMIIGKPLYYYRKNNESITNSGKKRSIDICICTNMLINDLVINGLDDEKILDLLNKKLARELFHFIRNKNTAYRISQIKKEMLKYICNYLDLRRKIQLKILIKRKNIQIID